MANSNRKVAGQKGLYFYGVSRIATGKGAPSLNVGGPGIDGSSPVKTVNCGEFICWVSEVDYAGFARAMERNLENLEWLALHSVRHQQVVGEVAAQTAIIPARFGTVFSGEPALLKNVAGRSAALRKVLARVTDADEWGVKVFAERKTPAKVEAVRSGKQYLQQKAAQIKQRPERDDPELGEFAAALGKVAAGAAPSGKMSGSQPTLVWQATFLVPRSRQKQWEKVLSAFVERWEGLRRIEVNGPWPPYSFVSDAE
jgi:gas vesicle protein GvpL/GvpF